MNFLSILLICIAIFSCILLSSQTAKEKSLRVLTVATEETDGYKQFIRSMDLYGYTYEVFGLNEEWVGGKRRYQSGTRRMQLIKQGLEKYKNDHETVVVITDSYDVIANQKPNDVLIKFEELNAGVLISAESECWPDTSLLNDYPKVGKMQKRFVNSGLVMGYADYIYQVLHLAEVHDNDYEQLYFTKLFLNDQTREKFNIKLDIDSTIFYNIYPSNDLQLFRKIKFNPSLKLPNDTVPVDSYQALEDDLDNLIHFPKVLNKTDLFLFNIVTKNTPAFIHGSYKATITLNRFGNYLPVTSNNSRIEVCTACNTNSIELNASDQEDWPTVMMFVLIDQPTPFLLEFFKKVSQQKYPKSRIELIVHNTVYLHDAEAQAFITDPVNNYKAVHYIGPTESLSVDQVRKLWLKNWKVSGSDFYFFLVSNVHLVADETMEILIEENKTIIAPLLSFPTKYYSTICGDLTNTGTCQQSPDYKSIVMNELIGVWNVPQIYSCVMINKDIFNKSINLLETWDGLLMNFPKLMRAQGIFVYATNMHNFGYLTNEDGFDINQIRPDLFQTRKNLVPWQERYIHPEYKEFLENISKVEEPCPDAFRFPLVSEQFCNDLVATAEDSAKWSAGKNQDSRLKNGYENVPTVDIHLRQIDFSQDWNVVLQKFINPMVDKIFQFPHKARMRLDFIVRYQPSEQSFLRPHHDAADYTLNVALNTRNVDFEGGGCNFVRRNCSVLDTKKGWAILHPSLMTHKHEGLRTTNGTRYILVNFINVE